uniref:ORF112 protein n=1 Tax=Turritis glabra TaxID=63678 RepID=A0A5H2V4U0_TURGL|nr:ORF112 protein [Turritis glabra]
MDSSTILIASFMIFSIGRTTVSGLNFNPSFFLHIVKGGKARFLLPFLIIKGPPAVVSVTHRASLSSVFLVLENGRHLSSSFSRWGSSPFSRVINTSPRTGMIIPARWVYIHP